MVVMMLDALETVLIRDAEPTSRSLTNMRTALVRDTQATRLEDPLCIKFRPKMAPADILYIPVVIIPSSVLWEGESVDRIAQAEAVSDNENME